MIPSVLNWVTSSVAVIAPVALVKVRVPVRVAPVSLAATSYVKGVFTYVVGTVGGSLSTSLRSPLWSTASVLAVNQVGSLLCHNQSVLELTSTVRSVLAVKSVTRSPWLRLRVEPGTLTWVTVIVDSPVLPAKFGVNNSVRKVIVPVRVAPVRFSLTW